MIISPLTFDHDHDLGERDLKVVHNPVFKCRFSDKGNGQMDIQVRGQ